ncbi:TPA: hypothetical protein N0F65_001661 [Lagenidium giganteum]|uniref:Uncharacterized protein n=1 Tax=Lagenidium giganteum TaxID=4803 RepID=A0AAV2Z0Z8_9STRA|nr:TPA: hypothetical protein N0F65_001661 [Lagenidium giganteum]
MALNAVAPTSNGDAAAAVGGGVSGPTQSNACSPVVLGGRYRWLPHAIVIAQALWAFIVPIKNVVLLPFPSLIDGSIDVHHLPSYGGINTSATPDIYTATQVLSLLDQVLNITLVNDLVRSKLEQKGDFVIDDLAPALTPEQHHILGVYYGLVLQSSEVFAGTLTPRTETVWLSDTGTEVTITCAPEDTFLQGMRCTNSDGTLCDDSSFDNAVPKQGTQLEPVDLRSMFANKAVGWHNSVGLLTLVDFFHQIMRQVFQKTDWKQALMQYQSADLVYNAFGMDVQLDARGRLVLASESDLWKNDGAYVNNTMKHSFSSCATTEVLLGYVYTRSFVIDLVQQTLMTKNLRNASMNKVDVNDLFRQRVLSALQADNLSVQVTIGAGSRRTDLNDARAALGGVPSAAIWHFARYPNSYYSYMTPEIRGDTVALDYKVIGAYHTGFNGMKFDYMHNMMAVWKLAEQPMEKSRATAAAAFEKEQRFADWFRNFEVNPDYGLVPAVQRLFGPMVEDCYRGLIRKIAQVVWVMALRFQPAMNHLAYTGMADGGDPGTWTINQMLVTELIGENPYGTRVRIPYVRATLAPDTGNAWPMVPLLHAFVAVHDEPFVVERLMAELNRTYPQLIEIERGTTNFRDVVMCPVGKHPPFIVAASDDKETMYKKIFPALRALVTEIVTNITAISTRMQSEVATMSIPEAFVRLNRSHPIFRFEGSPVYWVNKALSIGLIRLTTKEAPTAENLAVFIASMVCYDTIELRYLNQSQRCWNELGSATEVLKLIDSNGLRVVLFSMWSMGIILNLTAACVALGMWSMGIILNLTAACVALGYGYRLWSSWNLSGRKPIPFLLAISLDIQGIGLLNLLECTIMAWSAFPLISRFHLPSDMFFFRNPDQRNSNTWWIEGVVALALTWYVRLGMELARYRIHLKRFNMWYYMSGSYMRNAILVLIYLVRMSMPLEMNDYNRGVLKLFVSCVLATVLGYLIVRVSPYFEPAHHNPTDELSQLLEDGGFERQWFGVLGQSPSGWCHLGLLYEGWMVVERDGQALGMTCSRYLDFLEPKTTKTKHFNARVFAATTRTYRREAQHRQKEAQPWGYARKITTHSFAAMNSAADEQSGKRRYQSVKLPRVKTLFLKGKPE